MSAEDFIFPTNNPDRMRKLVDAVEHSRHVVLRLDQGQEYVLEPEIQAGLTAILQLLRAGCAVQLYPWALELHLHRVGELLHLERSAVKELIEQGHLPAHQVGPRQKVYLRDVLAFRERRASEAARLGWPGLEQGRRELPEGTGDPPAVEGQ